KEKVTLEQPPITLSVKPNGQVYWNDEAVTQDQLEARLAVVAQRQPQPQVDIRSDDVTKYGVIHDVTKTVRLAGIRKVGFVSSPERWAVQETRRWLFPPIPVAARWPTSTSRPWWTCCWCCSSSSWSTCRPCRIRSRSTCRRRPTPRRPRWKIHRSRSACVS